MRASTVRKDLYDAVNTYIDSDKDDLCGFVTDQLEELTAEQLAIPQEVYDNLIKDSSAESWEAFESFLIDHNDEDICSSCGSSCGHTYIDEGIGEYEFWGQVCHDKQMCKVSTCCEEAIV